MRGEPCCDAADRMGDERFARQFLAVQAVHHGRVRAEIAAPAHAHGREDRNVTAGQQSFGRKPRGKADGGSCCA